MALHGLRKVAWVYQVEKNHLGACGYIEAAQLLKNSIPVFIKVKSSSPIKYELINPL